MVKRFENWPKLLSDYLVERKKMPFEWGKNDCLSFVAGAIFAVSGQDFHEEYSTEEEANEILKKHGGVIGMISNRLGHEGSENVRMAGRGDVVVAYLPNLAAGIVDDSGRFFCSVNKEGLTKHPVSVAVHYWEY